jgi:hypothetical protein
MESSERVVLQFTYLFEPREVDTMNGFSQNDIFTQALGLAEPWFVSQVEFQPSEKDPAKLEVHITLDYQEGSKFPCPKMWRSMHSLRFQPKGMETPQLLPVPLLYPCKGSQDHM